MKYCECGRDSTKLACSFGIKTKWWESNWADVDITRSLCNKHFVGLL